ncbi:hypothetical protein EMIHUDRAFT_108015 [Emiliania huxleyi CCMP1516]|uniref:Uncharacterized protein n=2 Tax=Emiliania huxleyi TaxID=2903 RepID=A0A0D3HY08_EMIH1|nr:hypothetical protein EMIHUDRAFT_108015 [Emiliania huxleyi CCMP1516]EOD03893.1 hypothetical protein EMIHUDRAFT_108015 [Emiliania huxleyi CCMP1516]|eukprot:XP_005756322.1 hypothetical protein EMIHUDRAFT_108015 [Emiliania huxleyi CCMP1516]
MLLLAVLLASAGLLLSPRPLEMHAVAAAPRALAPAMAHHVNDKGAKKHNSCRPRKSRPSDRNRTPPSYPPLPEPTGPVLIGSSEGRIETVTISAKLTAAGAAAPEKIVFRGAEVTATLAACGLEEDASIEATVCKAA